ncbi:MAG: GNAT family N-acetyltransferase [Desulfobaccales bacterium]
MKSRGEITVSPVQNDASLWEFLRLPWRIYQGDRYWVPPILSEQRQFLDPRHGPFFENGEARYFLACQNGRPVGRLSAHINRLHDTHHGPETGFFGFFESIQDHDVAAALFEAAADWLRERGKTRLVGPLNFGIYDEMGLLVEGFDSMPVLFQTHNPPYYQDLLTSLGFVKAMDWHAYKITNRQVDLEAMERRYADIMRGQDFKVVDYDPKEVDRRADEIFQLFNTAWGPNWGHVPLSRRQFDEMFKMVKPCLRRGLAYVLLDNDRAAGFCISLPDLNPLIRKFNGRLTLWGKLRLLYWAKFRTVDKVRALVVGISQPYQRRYLHLAMILRTYIHLVKHSPCDFCDLSLIPSNLKPWIKVILALGGQRYKVFRVFEKPI